MDGLFSYPRVLYTDFDKLITAARNTRCAHGVNAAVSKNKIIWYKWGVIDSIDDSPAEIIHNPDHIDYWWRTDGVVNRINEPAFIRVSNGRITIVAYYRNGKLHNDDGPALVHKEDSILCWYRSGKLHREDGPAAISGKDDEFGRYIEYYRHGVKHRDDGPADIRYYKNSTMTVVWKDGISGEVKFNNDRSEEHYFSEIDKITLLF